MLAYTLQVTLCLTAFYVLYAATLSGETFFKVNRWYLIGTLGLSLLIPFLLKAPWNVLSSEGDPIITYTIEPIAVGIQKVSSSLSLVDSTLWWMVIALCLYWAGVGFLLLRFVSGLFAIRKMYQRGEHFYTEKGRHLIYSVHAHLPFSFFHWIFLSRQHQLTQEELEEILAHESAHASARHSIDVLFMELACIFLWPSPMIYFYRKSLRRVHEYLADDAVLQQSPLKHYGELLISQSTSRMQLALANHFFQSQLKNRIIMMTKDKSPRIAMIKYIALLPLALLVIAMFAFRDNDDRLSRDDKSESIVSDSIPDQVYKEVEEMPRFPGCEDAGLSDTALDNCSQKKLLEFINMNLKYPTVAKTKGITGTAVVQFTIRKDGSLADIKVVRSLAHGTDEAIVEVMNTMPKWRPGYHQGKAVDFQFILPVSFKLSADNKTTTNSDPEVFKVVEEMPRFPGCEDSGLDKKSLIQCSHDKLIEFVQMHMKYPNEARKAGAEGRGIIQFIIRDDGQLTDGKVVRSIGYGTDQVMLDVLTAMQEMPERWIPGIQGGKAVDVVFTLPFTFALPK